jgi:hypothetical protein
MEHQPSLYKVEIVVVEKKISCQKQLKKAKASSSGF